jgi:hypothetical protein
MKITMNRFLRLLPLTAIAVALLWGNASPLYAGCCEEGTRELFAEYISDYSPTFPVFVPNLPLCASTTASLLEEFDDAGSWVRSSFSNTSAWESDWKRTSLGGNDANFADASDFGYFCGQGDTGHVRFSTNMSDQFLVPSDTSFGDVDLEWVTFDTPKTLNSQVQDAWHNNAFKGRLHLLIGWHDTPLQGDTGGEFADDLIDWGFLDGGGDPIVTAWFASDGGCTDQDSGITQRVLAEDLATSNDHLHGQGTVSPDPVFDNNMVSIGHDC